MSFKCGDPEGPYSVRFRALRAVWPWIRGSFPSFVAISSVYLILWLRLHSGNHTSTLQTSSRVFGSAGAVGLGASSATAALLTPSRGGGEKVAAAPPALPPGLSSLAVEQAAAGSAAGGGAARLQRRRVPGADCSAAQSFLRTAPGGCSPRSQVAQPRRGGWVFRGSR